MLAFAVAPIKRVTALVCLCCAWCLAGSSAAFAASFMMEPVGLDPQSQQFKKVLNEVSQLGFAGNANFKVIRLEDELQAQLSFHFSVESELGYSGKADAIGLRWWWSEYDPATGQGERFEEPIGFSVQVLKPPHQLLWSPKLPSHRTGLFELRAELSNGVQLPPVHYQVVADKKQTLKVPRLIESAPDNRNSDLVWRVKQADLSQVMVYRVELFVTSKPPFFDWSQNQASHRQAVHQTHHVHRIHHMRRELPSKIRLGYLVPATQGRQVLVSSAFSANPVPASQGGLSKKLVLEYEFPMPEVTRSALKLGQQVYWRVVGIDRLGRSIVSSSLVKKLIK